MAKKKPEEPKAGSPEWMSTYSDLVTLLFCFFVLLYAMSSIDPAKFTAVAASFSGSTQSFVQMATGEQVMEMMGNGIIEMPTGQSNTESDAADGSQADEAARQAEKELQDMASTFKTYFAEKNLTEKVEMTVTETSIKLNFGDMLFDSGKDDLKAEALTIMREIASELAKYPDNAINIEGHTDDRPISTVRFRDNLDLSSCRATSVERFFINEYGINPKRITALGHGEYWPVADNDTPEGRQKNRRVEITIMSSVYSGGDGLEQ
ncbi:MAG: flagellar motor protein MotB [Clostridiales bacterium]|jgi:chemotaxis protein MotB|nr:flagellar motor protein MotB [Clostridiales bacterium]